MSMSFIDFLIQSFSSIQNFILVFLLSLVIFANGLSDAPNSIATCVSTKALSLKKSIFMASLFSFLGVFIMCKINISVAETIINLVRFDNIGNDTSLVLIGTFIAILTWIKIMDKYSIPVSESHALIASLVGASFAYYSLNNINLIDLFKVFIGIIVSVILGATIGYLLCKLCERVFKNIDRRHTKNGFRYAQIIGGATMLLCMELKLCRSLLVFLYLVLC